jgi:hypothetical protein
MGNFRQSPWWFSALNKSWSGTYFMGTEIRLEKNDLIRRARKITGLQDLGRDFDDGPLERLLRAANEEARLHPIGRFITRERFVSLLSIRLRAEYYFKKYPHILEQELYPAWIIVGLQRTGTTKLQRLLAEDPDHRVIPSWEVINPVPINLNLYDLTRVHQVTRSPGCPTYPHPNDKRIAIANTSVKALKFMSPGFFAVHPIDAMAPEEDILMLDVSFMSTTPEAMMHVPSYAEWLEKTDQSQAYAYSVKLLKFMQWIKPAKRWVLKTPHHLEFPDLIEKHFGEVHFLWPHRNVNESVPSFISMVVYNRMIFSNHVDEREVASHWVKKVGYMLSKALEYRNKNENDAKFTDINYKRFITDSAGELANIYKQNGGLTSELLELFKQHETRHPHQKHGVHEYSLADFGLTETDIALQTTAYLKFFTELYGSNQAKKIQ